MRPPKDIRPPAAALLLTLAAGAGASMYGFLDQGAIRYFRGDDAKLMAANLDAVLADPAHRPGRDWRNPQTGSHGSAVVLESFEHDGMQCRRVRVSNHARGVDDLTTADMCKLDGAWKVLRLPE
jgi:surface antigen